MKRLPFVLKQWTRTIWSAGTSARKIWDPRIVKIYDMWRDIEHLTVLEGARNGCLTFIAPEDLPKLTKWGTDNDLVILPMERGQSSKQYANGTIPYEDGKPWHYRVIITRKEYVDAWYECAYETQSDNEMIGELLGYPKCCRKFFDDYWLDLGYKDTTWPMAINSNGYSITDDSIYEIDIEDPYWECNILWRWMGIRLGMWLPCSFKCDATREKVTELIDIACDHGYTEVIGWSKEIFSWPLEWSALHGIAEIVTPFLKVSTTTDATAKKYIVRYHGDSYPDEGATGIVFPYKRAKINAVTEGKAFQRAFDVPLPPRAVSSPNALSSVSEPEPTPLEENDWLHNGFVSKESMDSAHDVLLQVLKNHFELGTSSGSVLDLGCGNGVLLGKICSEYEGLIPHGVEVEKDRFFSAYSFLSDTGEIAMGSISNLDLWPKDKYDLVVLMPRRLEELGSERMVVREKLLQVTDTFLLYGYGDDIAKDGGLDNLNKHLDLPVDEWKFLEVIKTDAASALLAVRKK